jgi:phosphonate transport system permease protein
MMGRPITGRQTMARRFSAPLQGRAGFVALCILYVMLVATCLGTLTHEGDLSLGRNPLANLVKTVGEFAHPSFLDVWFGDAQLQYKSDDGTVLRVENRQVVELAYLSGLASATWDTIRIATLGSLLGALLGLPLAWMTARNMALPAPIAWLAKALLDITRSIHTLVFGLVLVGIVGLGPTAGILAIGLHSMGTYGKLFSESIESLDMGAIEAVRNVGATPLQVFFTAVWPSVLPQFVSSHLYVWEFNIRDSTILGLIGAGGLGLLISEAASLFQWGRLSTVLIVVIALVSLFDAMSRRIRQRLL